MAGSGYDDEKITSAALAARDGDRAAATVFVELTQRHVHRFLGHLADLRDVEDLAQETYLRAMSGLRGFAARSSARTWLLSIARRVAADHVRAATRSPRTTPLEGQEVAAEAAAIRLSGGFEDAVVLQHLLTGLDRERREAFVATQVLGLSYADAAEVCDCPIGTIRSRVARAREDLVEALNEGRHAGRGRTGT
ncbi:sigma-70 family RNA polymerase sigma factor [Rugosimonospora acidiphila]|uniref:RNA polymerase sigma factor n=1 Tax=Rugosimonospora acidiphila TaxID=556531 RepID=A0ABP9RKZ9_9ACTN